MIEPQSIEERERSLILSHAARELEFVRVLIEEGDPERFQDIAAGLRKVADRYESLQP